MTYKEACSFFCLYGRISTDLEKVMDTLPTSLQLTAAGVMAERSGKSDREIEEAQDAIAEYWSQHGENSLSGFRRRNS